MKWYHTIWHFIIEAALVNGCISYNLQPNVKRLTHKQYRENVIKGLLVDWGGPNIPVRCGRKSGDTLPEARLSGKIHFIEQFEDKSQKPNCAVCSVLPSACTKKGKGSCKRKQTTYYCKSCPDQPPLISTVCDTLL